MHTDPGNVSRRKDEEHPEEERYNILGKVGRVLFVVCVFREEKMVNLE